MWGQIHACRLVAYLHFSFSIIVLDLITLWHIHSAELQKHSLLKLYAKFNTNLSTVFTVRIKKTVALIFRLDALALSVIATATWLGGCLSQPVLYQND